MAAEKRIPGKTILADAVIQTIAGVAAREVKGVHKLGKGALRTTWARIKGTKDTRAGVEAEVGQKEVAIDLEMVMHYGYNIPDVVAQIRGLVVDRVREMTGLIVKELNISVVDIHFETEEELGRVE